MNELDISRVYLINAPLENDYKHTLYFASKDEQYNYFKSKVVDESETFTYIRKDNIIHYPAHYDDIYNVNYIMYQNPRYNNKWFYAFVKDLRYENDECTIIEIETDVIQTWLFDYTIKPSFVEREHVSDDTVGKHTIPENLDTGEYVRVGAVPIDDENNNLWCYVVGVTRDYTNGYRFVGGKIYNGIYSGMRYFACLSTADVENLLDMYEESGYPDDIHQIFVCPRKIAGFSGSGSNTSGIVAIAEGVGATQIAEKKCSRPNKLDGYTPRNKKLLTYPYQYLLADNQCGGSTDYHYEKFKDPTNMLFRVYGVVSPGVPRILMPFDYGFNVESGGGYSDISTPYCLTLGRFPTCNWSSDVYTSWLVQNQANLQLAEFNGYAQTLSGAAQSIGGAIGMAGGGTTGMLGLGNVSNGLSGIYGGAMQIAGVMADKYYHSFTPNQSKGNANCGDVITSLYQNKPILQSMQIKREYAQNLDAYFDMFGYKVNAVKVPNKNHRSKWWYTKTIDINIDGNIPQNDMQMIKNAYNNGITFWKNPSEIQNYSLSNEIV